MEGKTGDSTAGGAVCELNVKVSVDAIPAFIGLSSLLQEIGSLCKLTAQCLEEGFELTAVDLDQSTAAAAGDCRTVFKPTDKLALLVRALGAFNRDARAQIGLPLDTH